ncbi:MAG: hypothetical protein AAF289_14095 [Cyanobacteria bacterium P01_A01_bin.135]
MPPADMTPGPSLSGRSLDFCLLAVCSCLLSLLCHHTGGITTQAAQATSTTPPQIDFVIKAGLATSPRQGTELEDEENG